MDPGSWKNGASLVLTALVMGLIYWWIRKDTAWSRPKALQEKEVKVEALAVVNLAESQPIVTGGGISAGLAAMRELHALMASIERSEPEPDDIDLFVAKHVMVVEDTNPRATGLYDQRRIRSMLGAMELEEHIGGSLNAHNNFARSQVAMILRAYLRERGYLEATKPSAERPTAWQRLKVS